MGKVGTAWSVELKTKLQGLKGPLPQCVTLSPLEVQAPSLLCKVPT